LDHDAVRRDVPPMSAPRPIRVGDTVVIYAPLLVVESVEGEMAEVVAEGLLAAVPVEWIVPVFDRRGGAQ
jgi:hypothetical protein